MIHTLLRLIRRPLAAIVAAIVIASSLLTAAAKVDPASRLRLDRARHRSLSRAGDGPTHQPVMLMVDDLSMIDTLTSMGVIVYNHRDHILLSCVPIEMVDTVLSLDGVINAAASGDMSGMMDRARPMARVDAVHRGAGLDCAYDGSGVVVGFSDIGFDPSHIAFDGRISQLHHYDTPYAIDRHAVTPTQIHDWATDDSTKWHATHVANILAGGYRGNDYYGVATGAEIVATTSRLHDVGILSGVEDIIAYASLTGRRPIINLSLGNYMGPHDGTDLFCRYLSACTDDAVILVSAGNEGNTQGFVSQSLDSPDSEGRVTVNDMATWCGFDVAGYVDLWSDDSRAFDFRIEVLDRDNGEYVWASPWLVASDPVNRLTVDADSCRQWGEYFSGRIRAVSAVSSLNGRYNLTVELDTHTTEVSSQGGWARYATCIVWRRHGDADVRVDVYADADNVFIGAAPQCGLRPSSVGSISDMATARGVISVGMCNSRVSAPSLAGDDLSWPFDVGAVCSYSSYSNTPGIDPLPHFCAPGYYVVSAISSVYQQSYPDGWALSAVASVDGREYYWTPECGTSMASPLAAGIMALWMQADPQLTAADMLELACASANRDFADITDPRWGAGCIDALAGMQRVLAGVDGIAPDADPMVVVNDDGRIELITAQGRRAADRVYSMSGVMVDASAPLAPGIYIVGLPAGKWVKVKCPATP